MLHYVVPTSEQAPMSETPHTFTPISINILAVSCVGFFFQAEDGIRDLIVTGVQTCALPISFRIRWWGFLGQGRSSVKVPLSASQFKYRNPFRQPGCLADPAARLHRRRGLVYSLRASSARERR